MSRTTVDPAAIEAGATRLEECADELGTHADAMFEATMGEPWGTDDAGTGFGNEYARLALHASFALQSHQHLLRDAAGRLTRWAGSTRANELRAGDQLRIFGQATEAE